MNDKERVAKKAAMEVSSGMVVGLGTGSSADCFIEALAQRHHQEGLAVQTVVSSIVSMQKAQQLGLPMMAIEHLNQLDYYVDGADEVTDDLVLSKGQGADLVREKILATAADKFIVLIDESKRVRQIGDRFPVPVEVIPFSWQLVVKALQGVGGQAVLRPNTNNSGLAVTSYGNLLLDVDFGSLLTAEQIDTTLNAMPGVIEHGIFRDLASVVYIGADGVVEELRRL
ncbi:MAG: ribose-5-phosphate isomerase RpiA [Methylococcales bacterium]|nr:ribose-5-phosphate isomerase RpiA [Methylococcales bacterium]